MTFSAVAKKNKLLIGVVITYLALLIVSPEKASQSLSNSMYYVREMLEIMPIVFIVTALIEAWVPKESIMMGFGEKSGFKGGLFSFLLGSLSVGPIYAAFPICKMLLQKGASIFNVVIILSAWAVIKVPMLANEAKFLGIHFMALRWVLTVVSIIGMAFLVSLMVNNKDVPLKEASSPKTQQVEVQAQYCVGCGICATMMPGQFKIVDNKAKFIGALEDQELHGGVREVVRKCPAKVIHVV